MVQANVLVDHAGRARVADFGLSSVNDLNIPHWTSQSVAVSRGGTAHWQAPEVLDGDDAHNTAASDIYAWACVCHEVCHISVDHTRVARSAYVDVIDLPECVPLPRNEQ
jgi:serine/threonine protein kinase